MQNYAFKISCRKNGFLYILKLSLSQLIIFKLNANCRQDKYLRSRAKLEICVTHQSQSVLRPDLHADVCMCVVLESIWQRAHLAQGGHAPIWSRFQPTNYANLRAAGERVRNFFS